MSRVPFQVLGFLRRLDADGPEYLVLKRADLSVWQGVAGGGEGDESPREAAIRETMEEVGVSAMWWAAIDGAMMFWRFRSMHSALMLILASSFGLAKSMRNTDGARRAKRLICWSGIRTGRRFVWLRQG